VYSRATWQPTRRNGAGLAVFSPRTPSLFKGATVPRRPHASTSSSTSCACNLTAPQPSELSAPLFVAPPQLSGEAPRKYIAEPGPSSSSRLRTAVLPLLRDAPSSLILHSYSPPSTSSSTNSDEPLVPPVQRTSAAVLRSVPPDLTLSPPYCSSQVR
jgi:hypothetical protein